MFIVYMKLFFFKLPVLEDQIFYFYYSLINLSNDCQLFNCDMSPITRSHRTPVYINDFRIFRKVLNVSENDIQKVKKIALSGISIFNPDSKRLQNVLPKKKFNLTCSYGLCKTSASRSRTEHR